MAKYDALISKLFPDKASQEIARSFVAAFADKPGAADLVEGYLREAARVDGLIAAGEMTQQQGQDLFSAASLVEQGVRPDVVSEITSWANKTVDSFAATDAPADPDNADADKVAASPPQRAAADAPAPGTHRPFAQPSPAAQSDRIAEIETKYMRAPEGSAEWRQYWKGPLADEYRGLVQAREDAAAAAAPAPSSPAPGAL